jgi:hypothetical protein
MAMRASADMYDGSTKSAIAYGVTLFAGVMLCTVAVFQILQGIAAISKDDVFVTGINYTYKLDVSQWGWIHLVLGVLALGTGIGIVLGQVWGFIAGIVIASLSALANFAFIPHYPLWSIVVIAFNVLVVWALCTQTARRESS